MSKSAFIIGLITACLAHSILFVDFDKKVVKADETKKKKIAKILIPLLPAIKEVKQQYKVNPVKARPIEPPEKVVSASRQNDLPGKYGDFAKENNEGLPVLRLIWDSPEHLIRVSKSLGLKVLPVNSNNEPIGELHFKRDILVGRFYGQLGNYSNRVRTISPHFFGSGVLSQCKENVRCFWVVVPSDIDRTWAGIQKQALQAEGLLSSQVSYMEAKMVNDGNGYKLIITKIEIA